MSIIRRWLKLEIMGSLSVGIFGVSLAAISLLSPALSKESFKMPTDGMRPTLVAGDRVIVDMNAYSDRPPQLNDLAVFIPVHDPGVRWVFRIAGIPGDLFTDEGDVLTRNGVPVVSPAFPEPKFYEALENEKKFSKENPFILLQNQYFFLSDDPEHLNDSRAWGPIPRENVLGKVTNFK